MNAPVERGDLLRHENHLYFVDDLVERHSGKQKPVVHVSLHEAISGRHIDRTLDQLVPIEPVVAEYHTMQYLYASGGGDHIFMDTTGYEESALPASLLRDAEPFLKSGDEFRVLFAAGQPVRLDLPDSVSLKVIDTAAPAHAVGASSSIYKDATLENRLVVRVPLFIKNGDAIRVSTRSREYLGKAQS